tara:strand:+ start:594 stop:860 length:267 start_codon:yes stop_codon:yes gene_type:complete
LSFEQGDKVWMISTSSSGIIIPSMRGMVTGSIDDRMMVTLENGHTVIHKVEDDPDSLVKFRKDWAPEPQPGSRHFFSPKNLFLNIFNK